MVHHMFIFKFLNCIIIYKFNKFPGAFISPRGPVFHKKLTLIFKKIVYKIIWYIDVQCGASEMIINFVKNTLSSKNKNKNF